VGGDRLKLAPWPTISGAVGEIEHHHPAFALLVTAAIAGSAYSALLTERDWVLGRRLSILAMYWVALWVLIFAVVLAPAAARRSKRFVKSS
jgi:hypothetical protein